MKHLKLSGDDSGIFSGPSDDLFDRIVDDTTPHGRKDLIDQAFLTNLGLGDPTTEASPPAVNPSLTGNLHGVDRVDELSAPAKKTDDMGDGMGEHDVLAAYDAGRRAAVAKYAQINLPKGVSTSTAATGTPKPANPVPGTVSPTVHLVQANAEANVAQAARHTKKFDQPGVADPPMLGSAELFSPSSGPNSPSNQMKTGGELPVRSDYGTKKPTRYSIPADNGQTYAPRTNTVDANRSRAVSKAFDDINTQRNADTLNDMGQASIGEIG